MIMADLHVHSNFSDGKLSVAELVDFYGERQFGCIAITDHICEEQGIWGKAAGLLRYTLSAENFDVYLETIKCEAERAWDQYRMILIPGYELSKNSWSNHRSAHILGLGVSQWLSAELDILSLTKGLRDQGALSIAAHPVHTGSWEPQTLHLWHRREELRHEFDAWEVASGTKWFKPVADSGLPMLATSDLHHPRQIHAWKTLLHLRRGEPNPEAYLEAIRQQRLEFKFWSEPELMSHMLPLRRMPMQPQALRA
ncbi:MAG TPA: PHP domain-containing protein [Pseudobdellovibrionaceae bacterium]|nr:PHP domain-containing protein [Pseudobdellovibrionaceae bacterium]